MAIPQTHVLSILNEMRVELVARLRLGCFRVETRIWAIPSYFVCLYPIRICT
jgi:hypothetical protein